MLFKPFRAWVDATCDASIVMFRLLVTLETWQSMLETFAHWPQNCFMNGLIVRKGIIHENVLA